MAIIALYLYQMGRVEYFVQYIILKNSKFISILSASLPAVRSSSASAMASVFHTTKVIAKTVLVLKLCVVPMKVYLLHHGLSYSPSFSSFPFLVSYRKERNSQKRC